MRNNTASPASPASPTTAGEYATAILNARRDVHLADVAADPTARQAAARRAARLDDRAADAGYGYREGVNLGDLDMQAAAEVYGPDSPVGRAYAAMTRP